MKRYRREGFLAVVCLLALLLYWIMTGEKDQQQDTADRREVAVHQTEFTESSRLLVNPNRGFYHMHGFVISDAETDYRGDIALRFSRDDETGITLIEINLREYRDRELSESGLANIGRLLEALSRTGKQLILRFLYDWDGDGLEAEPDTRDLIVTHMTQLAPLLKRYKEQIFVLQGLFVGDVGEMHGSRYLEPEDTRILAAALAEASDPETFLAVRTPAHWRRIMQTADAKEAGRTDNSLASRMGLYNDGMLGSGNDMGTYGTGTPKEDGPYVNWRREDELIFQEILCRWVPLGGETVIDNPYNDLIPAIKDMSSMHVTYLNRVHDSSVLEKWENTVISEEGCYDGMDGLSYVERHLGYRLVLRRAQLVYEQAQDVLSAEVSVQNVGFAPVYREADIQITLHHVSDGSTLSIPLSQDIRDLPGGAGAEQLLSLQARIPLAGLADGTWDVYLELTDRASGQRILFGNEQDPEAYGYRIGQAELITQEGRDGTAD